jgi:hypothetical protein
VSFLRPRPRSRPCCPLTVLQSYEGVLCDQEVMSFVIQCIHRSSTASPPSMMHLRRFFLGSLVASHGSTFCVSDFLVDRRRPSFLSSGSHPSRTELGARLLHVGARSLLVASVIVLLVRSAGTPQCPSRAAKSSLRLRCPFRGPHSTAPHVTHE